MQTKIFSRKTINEADELAEYYYYAALGICFGATAAIIFISGIFKSIWSALGLGMSSWFQAGGHLTIENSALVALVLKANICVSIELIVALFVLLTMRRTNQKLRCLELKVGISSSEDADVKL